MIIERTLAFGAIVTAGSLLVILALAKPKWIMTAWFVVALGEMALTRIAVQVGGYTVTLEDVLLVVTVSAAAARISTARTSPSRATWLATGVLCILILNVARGAAGLDTQVAVNEARNDLYFLGCLVYMASAANYPGVTRHVYRLLTVAAVVAEVYALVFWARFGLDTYSDQVVNGDYNNRALNAMGALLLAQGALVYMMIGAGKRKFVAVSALVAMVTLVLAVQRTVWLVFLVGLLVSFGTTRRSGSRSPAAVFAVAAGFGVIAWLVFLSLDVGSVHQGVTTITATDGTLEWRTGGWTDIVERRVAHGGVDLAIGQPSGQGFERYIKGVPIDRSTPVHSGYIGPLLSVGVLGFGALMVVYGVALSNTRWQAGAGVIGDRYASTCRVLVVTSGVFLITYSPPAYMGIIVGLALVRSGGGNDDPACPTQGPRGPGEHRVMRRSAQAQPPRFGGRTER